MATVEGPGAPEEVARLRLEVERLRARLEAREDGLDLDSIFPALPAYLFLFGADDTFLDCRAGARLFVPPDTFLGRRVDEVLPAPLGARLRDALARVRGSGEPVTFDYTLPEPDGEAHYEALILPLRGGRTAAFCTNVTDRRRAEEALRRSEERLRLALDAATDVVWDWNLVEDTVYQPRWAEAYGYPPEVTPRTGRDLVPFIHPEDMPIFQEQVRLASTGERATIEFEHRVRAASGEWKWMLARARVVARNARGEAIRIVGTCADVTERKLMLTRLQIADRMASVGTLAAGVAHEINNPLAYVMGNIGYALETLQSCEKGVAGGQALPVSRGTAVSECLSALREAQDGAQRVRSIVRDLKLFSRPDDEERTPVRLARVISAALNLAESDIRYRARLVTNLVDVPPVLANESRLSQVFLNLLLNAAQAIGEGRVDRNQISVETHVGAGGRVIAEVRDTGCGIPPEHRKRIFDPFFTTKAIGVGTGLGLTICHGIVTALGGEIEVESEVGKGSTFRVSLPAANTSGVAASASPPVQAPRRARILLVDDEPLFCRALERLLGSEHEVVSATDPKEALRRIEAGEHFDLILSDLAMAGMTGLELHAVVSRIAPGLADCMLFVTGGALTPTAAEFLAARPGRVLEKPLAPDAIRSAVARALQDAPQAARGRARETAAP
ncbi:MAG TPA: ATP-binding protein [Anaeromyxobacteraceae bacterium]|nr:ATP-binding protein [Anaeromyxobacteraceae bacterium]